MCVCVGDKDNDKTYESDEVFGKIRKPYFRSLKFADSQTNIPTAGMTLRCVEMHKKNSEGILRHPRMPILSQVWRFRNWQKTETKC